MGLFKYVLGGLAGGLLGVGTGVAAFGTAISGVGPGIAVGLLTIKAFSGGGYGQPLDDAGRERVRVAFEEYKRRLEPPVKKPPRKRTKKPVAAKPPAPRKTTRKKAAP